MVATSGKYSLMLRLYFGNISLSFNISNIFHVEMSVFCIYHTIATKLGLDGWEGIYPGHTILTCARGLLLFTPCFFMNL